MMKKAKNPKSDASRVNKTQKIREAARKLLEKTGSRPRPKDIIRELEGEKIAVTSPQVSQALAGTDLAFRQKRAIRKTQADFPDPSTAIGLVSVDDLIAARDYVLTVGTLDKAIAALVAFRQFRSGEAKTAPRSLSNAVDGISSEGRGNDRSPEDNATVVSEMRIAE
jgi:hypothetical protein